MAVKILQVNLNHARRAQDLFCHSLVERGTGLAIVVEPYQVSDRNSNWVGDKNGSVTIVRAAAFSFSLSKSLREA